MLKRFLYSIFILQSCLVFAHQPDLSSTMLVERENNQWILQIRAALLAFEQEVKFIHGEDGYDSPEKFQELILKHVKKNFLAVFNEKDTVSLEKGFVKLGHETNVVFEMLNLPKNIESVTIRNSSFQDIYNNQSAVIIFKEGFGKEQFLLHNENKHTAHLIVADNTFKLVEKPDTKPFISYILSGIVLLGFLLIAVVKIRKKFTS